MRYLYAHGGVRGIAADVAPSLAHVFSEAIEATSALDGVEKAIIALEDDPQFNAGFGSVLNREGRLELDAGIAYGPTGRSGGIGNVSLRHPITLARRVLESTPHRLITGAGASALGRDLEALERSTEEQHERFELAKSDGSLDLAEYGSAEHVDTVGAVGLDEGGCLAVGSSTGGVFGKMPGRVGDAPVFGAGIYASAHVAVAGTGVGELFLATLAAKQVGMLVEEGADAQSACLEVIARLGTRSRAAAGLLALDSHGRVGAVYRGGSWAVEGPAGPVHAVRLD